MNDMLCDINFGLSMQNGCLKLPLDSYLLCSVMLSTSERVVFKVAL